MLHEMEWVLCGGGFCLEFLFVSVHATYLAIEMEEHMRWLIVAAVAMANAMRSLRVSRSVNSDIRPI